MSPVEVAAVLQAAEVRLRRPITPEEISGGALGELLIEEDYAAIKKVLTLSNLPAEFKPRTSTLCTSTLCDG